MTSHLPFTFLFESLIWRKTCICFILDIAKRDFNGFSFHGCQPIAFGTLLLVKLLTRGDTTGGFDFWSLVA
jgi:hypothetical protein